MASSTNNGISAVSGGCRETHLRDQDLVRWLENKLGSTELWGGRRAASMLTREMLVELETCFQELEAATKLKIIQAMAHLSPKLLQGWKEPLLNLIELARRDPDDWVETMADLFRNFPDLGFIQCSSRSDSYFSKTLDELMQILIKTFDKDAAIGVQFPLPPDSELMNASAIEKTYGRETLEMVRPKHFTFKKQINKFDKLLADVKKASEQQNQSANRKNHGMLMSSFPIKIRSSAKKLDNDLPMRGLSSTISALKMSTGFSNDSKKFQQRSLLKRVGGSQLLDIAELPQPCKRRRTTTVPTTTTPVVDDQQPLPTAMATGGGQQQQQRKNSLSKRPLLNKKLANADIPPSPLKMARQRQQQQMGSTTNKRIATDKEEERDNTKMMTASNGSSSSSVAAVCASSFSAGLTHVHNNNNIDAFAVGGAPPQISSHHHHPSVASQFSLTNNNSGEQFNNTSCTASATTTCAAFADSVLGHHQLHMPLIGSYHVPVNSDGAPPLMSSASSSTSSTCFNNLFTEISDQQNHLNYHHHQHSSTSMDNINNVENEALKQFNGLLKDANKLSPLSYNMIVSFLSGNKTNPLMDKLGTLITLPLSETVEVERADDRPTAGAPTPAAVFLVETFFQMNYNTGEWKRLRKSRLLKPEEVGKYAHYLNHQEGPMNNNSNNNAMLPRLTTPASVVMPNFDDGVGGGQQQFQPQHHSTFWVVPPSQQQTHHHPQQQQH